MNLYEYQRSRSFFDLDPSLSDSIFLNFSSSITTADWSQISFGTSLEWGNEASSNGQVTWTRSWPQCPYMVKTFENFLLWNLKGGWPWKLLCTIEYYQISSNDAPGLTLTYFMARSNLVPYAFVWEKVKTTDFFRNCCSLWYKSW